MLMNHQTIDVTTFENEAVDKEARASNIQFDTSKPLWTRGFLFEDRLEDASELFNFGMPKEHLFYDVKNDGLLNPSMYLDYPHHTKIISYQLYASDVMNVVGREIYAIPDFMSDISGFFIGLAKLFGILMVPFTKT